MANEKRMIDANQLKRRILAFATSIKRDFLSIEAIIDRIDTESTVDAVEVVRCKGCKHWEPVHEHIPHMECQIFCGAYEHGYPTNADDFCSYGERKHVDLEDIVDIDALTKANNEAMRKVIDFIAGERK